MTAISTLGVVLSLFGFISLEITLAITIYKNEGWFWTSLFLSVQAIIIGLLILKECGIN